MQTGIPIDTTPPVITGCPNTVTVSAPAGSNFAFVSWNEPRASDNSGAPPTRSRTHTPNSSFPIGTTPVTYRFLDASGNTASCNFAVVVSGKIVFLINLIF